MKNATVKVLNDEDFEFVCALRNSGVNRNVSTLIIYLANVNEVSTRDIKKGTGLSLPDVSVAMRTLRDNNWVEEKAAKNEKLKGRPMNIYALSTPIDEIIKHYENEKTQESERTMESIQKLKELAPLQS
jgi:Predicted transcriptional regulator